MAPFLRIAFNSYELGSLQAADEANPPFCAVKMKEALSTGRPGGWTPEKGQQPVLLGVGTAGGPGGGARPCSPRTTEGSYFSSSSSPCPSPLWVQDSRGHHVPIGPPALAAWSPH